MLEDIVNETAATTPTTLVRILNSETTALTASVQLVTLALVLRGLFGLLGAILTLVVNSSQTHHV